MLGPFCKTPLGEVGILIKDYYYYTIDKLIPYLCILNT